MQSPSTWLSVVRGRRAGTASGAGSAGSAGREAGHRDLRPARPRDRRQEPLRPRSWTPDSEAHCKTHVARRSAAQSAGSVAVISVRERVRRPRRKRSLPHLHAVTLAHDGRAHPADHHHLRMAGGHEQSVLRGINLTRTPAPVKNSGVTPTAGGTCVGTPARSSRVSWRGENLCGSACGLNTSKGCELCKARMTFDWLWT